LRRNINAASGHLFSARNSRRCLFRTPTIQALREVGRTDCRGVSRRHPAIQRHVSLTIRNPGKTLPASAAGNRSSERTPCLITGRPTTEPPLHSALLLLPTSHH